MGRVYISGPMTGKPNFNRAAFEDARQRAVAMGYEAIVPGTDEVYSEQERHSLTASPENRQRWMRRDFYDVLSANEVWVLPGWKDSEGSRDEVRVAQVVGIPVRLAKCQLFVTDRVVTHIE